jgi:Domain of unknown function (DUF6915)
MYIAQHADACFYKFGKAYYEIHEFLDQYQEEYVDYGIAHRLLLHHKLGIDLIAQRFGEEARGPADLHIRQDLKEQLPEDWTYYGHFDDILDLGRNLLNMQNNELQKLYGDDVFDRVDSKIWRSEKKSFSRSFLKNNVNTVSCEHLLV